MQSREDSMQSDRNHRWLATHPKELAKHFGQWIAVVEEKIVASGKDLKKVVEEARKFSSQPLLMKVPDDGVLVV